MFVRLSAFILLLLLVATTAMAADKHPATPPATAKCAVCGMFVAKFPDWTASVTFRDGTITWYDGAKDLFTHLLDLNRYTPGRKQADVTAITVKEYYALKPADAKTAWYVTGSDVSGPMGAELIPFATEKDARSFMLDHKGKRIVRFNEITRQLLKGLR